MYWFLRAVLLYWSVMAAIGNEKGEESSVRDYCIIGAGPSGLQLGYFLKKAGRDYLIFERNTTAGSFYLHFPRHRTLISINKRNTGSTNKEFNFRHDWNSLITDDDSLSMRHYTKDYFPRADDYLKNCFEGLSSRGLNLSERFMLGYTEAAVIKGSNPGDYSRHTKVRYLQDYASRQHLNIRYKTEIKSVTRWVDGSILFHLLDQRGITHVCRTVLVCTGLWLPYIPARLRGAEHMIGYESMTLDRDFYENKKVLILGRGNAGFETADHIVGNAAYIHMASRSRIKMAYQTHYVGDVRAVNAQQVDTYQLKSLDGQFELEDLDSSDDVTIYKNPDGSLSLNDGGEEEPVDDVLYRESYDVIIRCLGFVFDFSIFDESAPVRPSVTTGSYKFPHILPTYQASGTPDIYFGGVNTHSLDYRKSAGGFIHGHRYTARALFRHLEWHYNNIPWPSVHLPYTALTDHLVRRINEASAPYQMFSVLADIVLINDDGTVDYLEEVPVKSMPMFKEMTGHTLRRFIMWEFEYGKNYSGPGHDVLREDRVHGLVEEADLSNFLHPVLYYYEVLPKQDVEWEIGDLPRPTLYHHIVEDFLTDWTSRGRHIVPLRKFLEAALDQDLRGFLPESCFQLIFQHGDSVPLSCTQDYMQGHAVSSSDGYVDFGSLESLEF